MISGSVPVLLLFAVEAVAICYVRSISKVWWWCESSVKADSACKIDVPQRQHLVVVVVALSLSGTPKTTSYMVVALSLSGTPKTTSYMVVALEWSKAASILYSHQFVSYWTQEYSSFETRRFMGEMWIKTGTMCKPVLCKNWYILIVKICVG